MKSQLMALALSVLTSSVAMAQAVEEKSINPFFHQENKTIFVSGPLPYWNAFLRSALAKNGTATPEEKINRIVFVNATSLRPEVSGGEFHPNRFMKEQGVETVVIGRCDLFCSRYFVGGVARQFGQDLAETPSHIDIQVPVDYNSQTLEPRYPNTQLAIYEKYVPGTLAHKDILQEGLTRGGWTGGLTIGAQGDVQFCESREPEKNCKTHHGVTAFSMGMVTQAERLQVELPKGFGSPKTTGFAEIKDVNAVPLRKTNGKVAMKDAYKDFISRDANIGKAFALSESEDGFFAWAAGGNADGNAAAKALKICEEESKSKCRLYAVDDRVVW